MTIAGKTVLVTGANRGIGQALVAEALRRDATRVYAGTRQPLAHPDGRVTPLRLDVTNPAQIQAAAEQVASLDLLINNAGIWRYDDLSDRAMLEEHLAVNLFGPWGVTQALLPLLVRSRGGGGHLPRSLVGLAGRRLARRGGQGARAPERGARTSGARRSRGCQVMSKGMGVDSAFGAIGPEIEARSQPTRRPPQYSADGTAVRPD